VHALGGHRYETTTHCHSPETPATINKVDATSATTGRQLTSVADGAANTVTKSPSPRIAAHSDTGQIRSPQPGDRVTHPDHGPPARGNGKALVTRTATSLTMMAQTRRRDRTECVGTPESSRTRHTRRGSRRSPPGIAGVSVPLTNQRPPTTTPVGAGLAWSVAPGSATATAYGCTTTGKCEDASWQATSTLTADPTRLGSSRTTVRSGRRGPASAAATLQLLHIGQRSRGGRCGVNTNTVVGIHGRTALVSGMTGIGPRHRDLLVAGCCGRAPHIPPHLPASCLVAAQPGPSKCLGPLLLRTKWSIQRLVLAWTTGHPKAVRRKTNASEQ
jgi:hypothetical protein